jgi:hypothetical protein
VNLTLRRITQTPECTQGELVLPEGTVLHTLELRWIPALVPGGMHDHSCVPLGLYQLALHNTAKHPQSFALVNPALGVIHEPEAGYPTARVACLIHVANYPVELLGCIGVGLSCGVGLLNASRAALAEFNAQVPWVRGHTLEIVDATEAA